MDPEDHTEHEIDIEIDIDADLEHVAHPDLGAALRAALAPTQDVRRTARNKVDRTLQDRSLTSSLADIAGAGLATVLHLLTNPPPPADRNTEVNDD